MKIGTQPDFQALFFDYFGSKPRRHRYELRFLTSNLHHDLIFLGSLIHDARFKRNGIRTQKDKITIQIERDTWEVGTLVRENAPELHYCRSELKLCGVTSVEWRFTGGVTPENTELWIRDLSMTHLRQQDCHVVIISGEAWQLAIALDEDKASVVLQDKESPISHATARESNG